MAITLDLWPHPITSEGRTVYQMDESKAGEVTLLEKTLAKISELPPFENQLILVNGQPTDLNALVVKKW